MSYQQRNYNSTAKFEDLLGKTISELTGLDVDSEQVNITTTDGMKFRMWYEHDCCASCSINEIHGDIADLVGSPILLAEKSSSNEHTPEFLAQKMREKEKAEAEGDYYYAGDESFTWTFYKLSTIKGSVTIKWYGSSNGFYSESASFEELGNGNDE